MLHRLSPPIAALLLLGACAVFPRFKPVSEMDMGRLAPGQLGPLQRARLQAASAEDEVARATLRLQDAALMVELGAAGRTATRGELQLARARQRAAASTNDPAELARAGELWVLAVLHDRSTQAHAAHALRLVEARRAELDAAGALVQLRAAEIDRAALQALLAASIPEASAYDPAAFEARVAAARQRYRRALDVAARAGREADGVQDACNALDGQYQARLRAGRDRAVPPGTISGALADRSKP